jgi:hypothetical protein
VFTLHQDEAKKVPHFSTNIATFILHPSSISNKEKVLRNVDYDQTTRRQIQEISNCYSRESLNSRLCLIN